MPKPTLQQHLLAPRPRSKLTSPTMEQVEHFFACPYCFEQISMVLDLSIEGMQRYIEDCEVCCQPIEISYEAEDETIVSFDAVQS
jgi:transcription elongation factor Elf1